MHNLLNFFFSKFSPWLSYFVLNYVQKVGVPSEVAFLLEEICRENNTTRCSSEIGADPELDEFMVPYEKNKNNYLIKIHH